MADAGRPRVIALADRVPRIDDEAFVAPGAVVVGDVTVGARASIWYSAVLRGDLAPLTIGAESSVQDGCVFHADVDVPVVVGDRVTVGHRVIVHGATVGSDVLIGMGSILLNGADIGAGSLLGAGTLVTQGMVVPRGSLVLGAPARVLRPVRDEERALIEDGAKQYVELAERHRRAVRALRDDADPGG